MVTIKKTKPRRLTTTILCILTIIVTLVSYGYTEIIWSRSFDDYETGNINRRQAMEIFESYWGVGPDEGRVEISEEHALDGKRRSLKVTYPKGYSATDGSGFCIDCNIGVEADSLWLTYYVYIPHDFDWRHGGKLPGLKGSTAWREREFGWSGRLMWRENGLLQWYMHGTNQTQTDWIDPVTNDSTKLPRGQWNKLELFYKINPVPGNMEGSELRAYLNGKLARGSDTVQMFQDQGESGVNINNLFLCTFYGGSSDPKYFPIKDEFAYFDNFVVSTSRLEDATNMSKAPPVVGPSNAGFGEIFVTAESIRYTFEKPGVYQAEIFALNGDLISALPEMVAHKGYTVDLLAKSRLAPGGYLLKIAHNCMVEVKRFTVVQ